MHRSAGFPVRCSVPVLVLLLSVTCLALQRDSACAAVSKPVIELPAWGRVDVTLNPSLGASAFSGGGSHKATEWQLDDFNGYAEKADYWTAPEWTRASAAGETATVVNAANGTFANTLAGRSSLDSNEAYNWRVRYQDSTDTWSDWSDTGFFVTATSTWYLAEGSTEGGMETWVLVQNPGDVDALIGIEFQTSGGAVSPDDLQNITVSPNSRISINVGTFVTSYDVSTRVVASVGTIVCERAMYGPGRVWGHDSIGVTTPSSTWYLAEGCTGGDFETWVLVQNPNAAPVTVDLSFMTSSGPRQGPQNYNIPAVSRVSFDVSDYVTDYDVSTRVASTGGDVICERAMYGNGRQWGHDSIGATSPDYGWCFAEGCTLADMQTWLLVQNPMDYTQNVRVYIMDGSEEPGFVPVSLAANSRVSINLGLYSESYNVSATVLTVDKDTGEKDTTGMIVCERAMYDTSRTWGHDSIGTPFIYPLWVLPEGSTGGGTETWVLVQNPTYTNGTFNVVFMTDTGIVPGPQNMAIAAYSRVSINAGDYVDNFNVSTWVSATVPVVCERSMYGGGKVWAHNSIGYMLGLGNVDAASTGSGEHFDAASLTEGSKELPRL